MLTYTQIVFSTWGMKCLITNAVKHFWCVTSSLLLMGAYSGKVDILYPFLTLLSFCLSSLTSRYADLMPHDLARAALQ